MRPPRAASPDALPPVWRARAPASVEAGLTSISRATSVSEGATAAELPPLGARALADGVGRAVGPTSAALFGQV
jgi:hypothetical protein